MSTDKERVEDLNPGSEDINEKVRRMLDPSVPDVPEPTSTPKSNKKIEVVSHNDDIADEVPSAPALPSNEPGTKASKKVIEPINEEEVEPAKIKQITIVDDSQSPSEVGTKLDKAIANLETQPEQDINVEDGNKAEVIEDTKPNIEESDDEKLPDDYNPDLDPLAASKADDLAEPDVISSSETEKAVDEIVAREGDEILEVEDAIRDTDESEEPIKKQHNGFKRIKNFLSKPAVRWAIVLIVLMAIITSLAVPRSRYVLLNTAGVRAKSSVLVLDQSTQQPLKNVHVTLGSASGVTDINGKVELTKVKLGPSILTIEKRAFATINKTVVVGWGSNPFGDISLTPVGTQYNFTISDYLSGKPIPKIEAVSNDANAISDEKGIIKLTIDRQSDENINVIIKGEGYRAETITIDPNDKSNHTVKLVPSRKQVFVSKRSGKFDIYSVYIDGKDEKLLLAGSGNERDDMVLVPHPSQDVVAYVSTRANQRNSDGYLLSNLLLVSTEDGNTNNIVASERIQVVDWSGDYLVYVQIVAGSSANSPERYRLNSYNLKDNSIKKLASANYFNDVIAAKGSIYYAPSSAYQTGQTNFYKVNPDGTVNQAIFSQEVWNTFRVSYDHFALSVQQQWYDFKLGDKAPVKLNSAPVNQSSRVYVDSPNGKNSIWIDKRDGKGVLIQYDIATQKENVLQTQSGLVYPVNWLNDKVVVYRVKTDQETADYALNIDGGKAVKIRDVTNFGGINRWYYY